MGCVRGRRAPSRDLSRDRWPRGFRAIFRSAGSLWDSGVAHRVVPVVPRRPTDTLCVREERRNEENNARDPPCLSKQTLICTLIRPAPCN